MDKFKVKIIRHLLRFKPGFRKALTQKMINKISTSSEIELTHKELSMLSDGFVIISSPPVKVVKPVKVKEPVPEVKEEKKPVEVPSDDEIRIRHSVKPVDGKKFKKTFGGNKK